jgi:hypothetical protein
MNKRKSQVVIYLRLSIKSVIKLGVRVLFILSTFF